MLERLRTLRARTSFDPGGVDNRKIQLNGDVSGCNDARARAPARMLAGQILGVVPGRPKCEGANAHSRGKHIGKHAW